MLGMKLFLKPNKQSNQDENNINYQMERREIINGAKNKSPDIIIKDIRNKKNSVEKKHVLKVRKDKNLKLPLNNNLNEQQNNDDENCITLDKEILKLWEDLKVTDTYKENFCKKLSYFKENIQENIIRKEKESLIKVLDRILVVTSAIIKRERKLKEFKTLDSVLIARSYIKPNEIINQAKNIIKEIKSYNIELYKALYELQKIFIYDAQHNKYDIFHMPNNYLFREDFFMRLQEDTKILYNSDLGNKLKIKNIFDPLLLYIDEDDQPDLKGLTDVLHWLNNHLVYTDYKITRKQKNNLKYVKISKKLNIDAKNPKIFQNHIISSNKYLDLRKNENTEKTSNDDQKIFQKKRDFIKSKNKLDKHNNSSISLYNENQSNDNLKSNQKIDKVEKINKNVNDHLIIEAVQIMKTDNISEEQGLFFYQGKIYELENLYKEFYANLSDDQKITFNINKDINCYGEGIFPMIILKKENGKIVSFISMQFSNEKEDSLCINTIGTLGNVQESLSDLMTLLQTKNIKYNLLLIDLYYKRTNNNTFELNKEINLIFKLLKFRWVKLENHDGIRFQKMKFTNDNYKLDDNKNDILPSYLFKIKSSLLISTGEKNDNNNINYKKEKEINRLNLNICENIFTQNQDELEKITKSGLKIDMDEDESIQNIYDKIKEKKLFSFGVNSNSEIKLNKNYWSYFESEFQSNTVSFATIKGAKYIRVKGNIQFFFEKETEQKYYMLISSDSNALILGNINNKTKNKIMEEYNQDLFSYFKFIYPKLTNDEMEEVKCIYLPKFNMDKNINMNNINSVINNIVNVEYSEKINSNMNDNISGLKFLYYDFDNKDVILDKPLLVVGININLQSDNPIMFCEIFE